MAIVKRANVVLRVTDAELDKYLAKGYNVIDESGNIVREADPNDVPSLKAAYVKHKEEIAELKAQISELNLKLEVAQSKPKRKAKAEQEDE